MREKLSKRRLGLGKARIAQGHGIVDLRTPLIDALPQEQRCTKCLRQTANEIRRVGCRRRRGIDVATAQAALPNDDAVLQDHGGESGNRCFYSERFEVTLEESERESLS